MMGIFDGGLIKPNRKVDDRCVSAFTVTNLTTFLPIGPKWLPLKIVGEFSAESNYVLILPETSTERKAVEVTHARNANADTTLQFVTKRLKQPIDDFLLHKTRAHRVKSFILSFWSMSMDSSAAHYSTPWRVVHTRHPLFWIILAFDRSVRNSSA